jgi:hypothetical protein
MLKQVQHDGLGCAFLSAPELPPPQPRLLGINNARHVMAEQSTHTIERIARVLAGERFSANAEGNDPSAGGVIDNRWPEYREEAIAVLKSLRDPPPEIEQVIGRGVWANAIAAALGEAAGSAETESKVEEVTESVSHFLRAPS